MKKEHNSSEFIKELYRTTHMGKWAKTWNLLRRISNVRIKNNRIFDNLKKVLDLNFSRELRNLK